MSLKCTVCCHPERHAIDFDLLAGATLASLAARYGLSTSALSRHHQHLKQRLKDAKQVLEQQRQQEYLVTLASLAKLLLVSAETALNNEDYPLLIKLSQQIGNNFKLILKLPVQLPDFACYHLLTSEDWPVQGLVISDNESFYEEERRLIARNFIRPCDELDHPAVCDPLAQGASPSPPAEEDFQSASTPAASAVPADPIISQPSSTSEAHPKASGKEVGRNRDRCGMQVGQKWDASGMQPENNRNAGVMELTDNRNIHVPPDSQQTDFPGLLPEILNLLPVSELSKLYIDDPEGRLQRFLPRYPQEQTSGSLNH